jgi:hypothetical protein
VCCKQQHSLTCLRSWESPGDSVVFHMSDELGGRIEAAEADYETAFEVVNSRIGDAEDNYVVVHGNLRDFSESLNRFGEFLAWEMDNDVPVVPTVTAAAEDSEGSIQDDPEVYYYKCAFCPIEFGTGVKLKTHIESVHQDDLFQFQCGTCGFKAEGPRNLREHIRLAHGAHGALSAATIAVIGLELDGHRVVEDENAVTRPAASGQHGASEYPPSNDDSSDDDFVPWSKSPDPRGRRGDSSDNDYKPDPVFDGPRGKAALANARRAPMAEWAISCFRPPLQYNNEVTSTSGGGVEDIRVQNCRVVTLEVTDMSDSSGWEDGLLCPGYKTLFATRREMVDHLDGRPCSRGTPSSCGMDSPLDQDMPVREIVTLEVANMPDLGGSDGNLLCPTCQTLLETEREMDYHEPCSGSTEALGAQGAKAKITERSHNTDSLLDQILCRYCQKHCEATILHPNYERTGCPPRISDEEQARLREMRASTAPNLDSTDNYFDYFENGQAHSARPAHSPICPGFNKMGVEGFCTFDRHILNASGAPGNLEDGDPNEIMAARGVNPRKTKAAFTNAPVVSTSTTYGRNDATMARDGHNYVPPRGDSRGDTNYDREGDGSSVGSGHHSDPKEFDEDDDDSDPSCRPTCPKGSRCKKCYTSSEGNGDSESEPGDNEVGATVSLETYLQGQRDRLSGRAADRIEQLLLMLNNPADGGRGGGAALSKPEIERQIERLYKFQRQLDE